MTPYYQDQRTTIYNGDSTSLAMLHDNTIDLTVTSPPYNLDMPYRGVKDNASHALFVEWMTEWLRNLWRVSKTNGRLCLNIPLDTNKGGKRAVYADYVHRLKATGWEYQTTIVWNESNISRRTAWGSFMKPSAPFVTAPVEMIIVAHKGVWKRAPMGRKGDITRQDFLNWTLGMWTFPGANPRQTGHPAAFPAELPKRLIQLYSYTTDVILDPFLGSGTTCRVARRLGRTNIGIELSTEYCKLAVEGIEDQDVDFLVPRGRGRAPKGAIVEDNGRAHEW
jgi:site-specific DNA-methyltransferase (adenine-specific)